jgi:hypothetical protein
MGAFMIKQSIKSINYSTSVFLHEIDDEAKAKIKSILVGDVDFFEQYEEGGLPFTSGSKSAISSDLNKQIYSVGKKDNGLYKRSAVFFQDVKQDKNINDFDNILDSFHCHKDIDEAPEYLNLLRDRISSNKLV